MTNKPTPSQAGEVALDVIPLWSAEESNPLPASNEQESRAEPGDYGLNDTASRTQQVWPRVFPGL